MGRKRALLAKWISERFGRSSFLKIKMFVDIIRSKKESYLIRKYNVTKEKIIQEIANKDQIEVIFFVLSISMWKYHEFFSILLKDKRFRPLIVPFVQPGTPNNLPILERDKIISYCKKNRFPFRADFYDYERNNYCYIDRLYDADIIVYPQPYNRSFPELKIEKFINNTLFLYTPYGAQVDHAPMFYDTLLQNISLCCFLSSPLELKCQQSFSRNKGKNGVIVGLELFDEMEKTNDNPWKEDNRKKIIWAPHHSIRSIDPLNNSTFLEVCDEMLALAEFMKKDLQFAFKPHPSLKGKLYEVWGEEKTNQYFNKWSMLENSFISEGQYAGLFKYSDAMIHDCSSFTCEYLITGNPVMYLTKNKHEDTLNEFGKACYDLHYRGKSIEDIKIFINDQVIGKKDPKKEDRRLFVKNELKPLNGKSIGENMYDALIISLNKS